MPAAIVVPIEVRRIIELLLAHGALEHATICFCSHTLLALDTIAMLRKLLGDHYKLSDKWGNQ